MLLLWTGTLINSESTNIPASDEVLFVGEGNKLAIVHLTWSGPGDHQYPSTEFFATWSEFASKKMAVDNLGY